MGIGTPQVYPVPSVKSNEFKQALPTAEAALTDDITTDNQWASFLYIYFEGSVTGILRVSRKVGSTTVTEDLNEGIALTATSGYMFTVPINIDDTINLVYSVTTGTYNLIVYDVGAE